MRALVAALGLLLAGGCATVNDYLAGGDSGPKPAPLVTLADARPVEQLWQRRIGKPGRDVSVRMTPAVLGDAIYAAAAGGQVQALDADSGALRWEVDVDAALTGGVGVGSGLVLVGSARGEVIALEASDGTQRWRSAAGGEILAAPQASEGVVVVRTGDGRFTALDAAAGTRLWSYDYTRPALTLRASAAPLLGQGVALSGLENGKLVMLSLENGAPLFQRTLAPPRGRTELDRMVDVASTPRALGSMLYVAGYQGYAVAIDLKNGEPVWTRQLSTHQNIDVDERAMLVTATDDHVWALDRRDGRELWRQDALSGRRLTGPVSAGESIVVADSEGYVHWLDRIDGRLLARTRVASDGVSVAPVARRDRVYVYDRSATLTALRVTGA